MNRPNPPSLPGFMSEPAASQSMAMNLMVIAAGSALIAIAAQFSIRLPFSPVPMTLQPLALLLVAAALGPVRGAATAALYLLEGLAGFPVFAGGTFGLAVLAGPTAGFLYAFPVAAWIAGAASARWSGSPIRIAAGMAVALAAVHLGGWSWLTAAWGLTPFQAWTVGVAPFLIGDIVKIAIAAAIAPFAQNVVKRTLV